MSIKYKPDEMRQRLLGIIEQRKLSLREVSLGSGQSESYLSGVLKRGRDPQLTRLLAVCEFLNVSAVWVLYGFDFPDGADEIFQLITERPELASSVASLLRAQPAADG